MDCRQPMLGAGEVGVGTRKQPVLKPRRLAWARRAAGGLAWLTCWSLCFPGQAANWYVDKDATGANNGTNWANAWTNPANVVWGAAGVKAGDTLYLSGGSTRKIYTNSWVVGASGQPGNPIRIAIDAANPSHSGKVIFDYNYAGDQAEITAITCLQDFVVFDGNVNGECHLVINNLRNILDRFETVGIYADSTEGVVVDHLASTNCNNPIRFIYATNFTVRGCNLRQVRGDAAVLAAGCVGSWDANLIYSNHFELLINAKKPPGKVQPYYGPDGIQCSDGVSIFGNTFHEISTTNVYTSDQHPDFIQATGQQTKIYANEFINIGDAGVDYGLYDTAVLDGLWIYNNVFRIVDQIDPYPEFIRIYDGTPAALLNIKIVNNTFVDNNTWRAISLSRLGEPATANNEIKNNIFYNCGANANTPAVYIEENCSFTTNSFQFDANIYYHPLNRAYVDYGATYVASAWVERFEPRGKTNAPVFVAYAAFGPTNNLQLASNDVVAVNAGDDLSAYFTSDKKGVARPQGAAWDIGAYEYSGAPTNPPPVVSPIGQNLSDTDPNAPGLQIFTNSLATYTGSAAASNGNLLSWKWVYSVNGGPEVVYQSGTGTVASVNFNYGAGTAGKGYVWKLRANDGLAAAETQLKTEVILSPRNSTSLVFEAESGVISPPFMVADGAVFQEVESGLTNGGRAAYSFNITKTADYLVQARVDAPFLRQRSFYVNIDGEPEGEQMTWTVPVTIGFENHYVSWQGTGSCVNPQFSPKVFHLSPGPHSLVVRGREANARLDQFSIVLVLPEIQPLGADQVSDNGAVVAGQVNALGLPTYAYFEYGRGTNLNLTSAVTNIGASGEVVDVNMMLSGLAPRTVYRYRLVAYNSNGTNYGATRTFTTAFPILHAPIFQNGKFSVSVATATNRFYFLQARTNVTDPGWAVVTNVPGNGQMQTLTDTKATNARKLYRVIVFPLPEVTVLPAAAITDSSAVLNGLVDPIEVQATAYFEYGATTNYGSTTPAFTVDYDHGLSTISNLVAGLLLETGYNFRLVAYNAFGTNLSPNQTFTTTAIRLQSFAYHEASFSVLVSTTTGRDYYLVYKTNLSQVDWIVAATLPGDGLIHPLVDASATDPQRFYRVRVE